MVKKNESRHLSNCEMATESAVISTDESSSNVPVQKRKVDAEQTLYLFRV
jgi:hypothetical protein